MTPLYSVIFDWDNTLVDTEAAIISSMKVVCQHFKKDIDLSDPSLNFGSQRDTFPSIFGTDWQEAIKMFNEHYMVHHFSNLTPKPGALEILKKLIAHKVVLGVVSNKEGYILRSEIGFLGWGKYFWGVVGSKDCPFDKPHPLTVFLALQPHFYQIKHHVWFIGDNKLDLECARNSESWSVLICPKSKLGNLKPDFHFESLNELGEHIPEPARKLNS